MLPKSYKKNPLLFFAYDYLNDLAVYLVNLRQYDTDVIVQSTNHDLSNQMPSKDQKLNDHNAPKALLLSVASFQMTNISNKQC